MRPPICVICNKEMLEMKDVELVYFKKRPSDVDWDKMMKEKGWVGHPPYVEWFCAEHLKKARDLEHLPIDEALKILRGERT